MHDSIVETAAKTEQDPQPPWSFVGETRPWAVRSTEAGRVVRRLLIGASSSLSAFSLLLSISSWGGGGALPVWVVSTSSSVRSDRQVTRAVQVEERSAFCSRIFCSFAARISLRLSLSLGCLLQAVSKSYGIRDINIRVLPLRRGRGLVFGSTSSMKYYGGYEKLAQLTT